MRKAAAKTSARFRTSILPVAPTPYPDWRLAAAMPHGNDEWQVLGLSPVSTCDLRTGFVALLRTCIRNFPADHVRKFGRRELRLTHEISDRRMAGQSY